MDKTADSGSADGGSIPLGYILGRKERIREMSDMTNKPTEGAGLLERIKTDEKMQYGVIGGALAIALIIIMRVCVSCSKKDDNEEGISDNTVSTADSGSEDTSQPAVADEGGLVPTSDEAVMQLINSYYGALAVGDSAAVSALKSNVTDEEKIKLEKRAELMESIDNIQVYTRPGPVDGTYVAFVYYEMKFIDIETRSPGLTTIYICKNEDGSLYINNGEWDEATTAYIEQIASEEAIADYFKSVQVAYNEAVGKDVALALRMEQLPQILDDAVRERQEQAAGAEQPADQAAATPVNETVVATTKVNVRASDSENADKLGQVESGATMTRYETRENGWSKIDYNGQEGYIKSEFLQVQGTNEPAPVENTAPEQEEEEPVQAASASGNGGKVTATSSVRVRSTTNDSSTDNILGTLFPGESCDLIMEQADGWCKIKYNGETAYVKTEFVEIN